MEYLRYSWKYYFQVENTSSKLDTQMVMAHYYPEHERDCSMELFPELSS